MSGSVIFLLLFVMVSFMIFSFSFVVVNTNNERSAAKEKAKVFEFSTFTSAVCENKEEVVHCKDEVFVNCNGKISKLTEMRECNGFKLNLPEAVGFAVFEKGWKDTRD